MMKFTHYSYYLKIKDNLIELSIEQEELIDAIVSIVGVQWHPELMDDIHKTLFIKMIKALLINHYK